MLHENSDLLTKFRKEDKKCITNEADERQVLTTHTVCKHCRLIRYETNMGPELSTAAADQNFAWICKQHQDLIGSVLIFRTKIGPDQNLVWYDLDI